MVSLVGSRLTTHLHASLSGVHKTSLRAKLAPASSAARQWLPIWNANLSATGSRNWQWAALQGTFLSFQLLAVTSHHAASKTKSCLVKNSTQEDRGWWDVTTRSAPRLLRNEATRCLKADTDQTWDHHPQPLCEKEPRLKLLAQSGELKRISFDYHPGYALWCQTAFRLASIPVHRHFLTSFMQMCILWRSQGKMPAGRCFPYAAKQVWVAGWALFSQLPGHSSRVIFNDWKWLNRQLTGTWHHTLVHLPYCNSV